MRLFEYKPLYSHILLGIILFILIPLVLTGIWIYYETSESAVRDNAARLRVMDHSHIDNSFRMIDTGLKLYDNTYNAQMGDAFLIVMDEYNRSRNDPSRMNLESLKQQIGGMDIYVIDDRCVIQYSSSPADIGLDFTIIYPDFCAYLHRIWNTSGFYPDRVVMDWVSGTLTKFGYLPTPDHHYILELGMKSDRFAQERMELQYSDVVAEIQALDPYIEEVLLFQKQKRLVYNTSYVPTPAESEMLDYLLWENRSSQVIPDPERERTIVWQVIDLRDPDYAADMSIFAKITYNNALLTMELNRLWIFSALFAGVVLMSGALLAFIVSRKLSRPIEQLVEDVDAIAGGDLDHPISHVSGYEFTVLERSIQMMVERLKDHIQKCERSERRFTDLVQLLPQGIFETDLQGQFTFANPDAFQRFGYSPSDLDQGLTIYDVLIPEDRDRQIKFWRYPAWGEDRRIGIHRSPK
jgi:Signal transduction histidine kinase involved in nitrogen fixation and metabolism regulation